MGGAIGVTQIGECWYVVVFEYKELGWVHVRWFVDDDSCNLCLVNLEIRSKNQTKYNFGDVRFEKVYHIGAEDYSGVVLQTHPKNEARNLIGIIVLSGLF